MVIGDGPVKVSQLVLFFIFLSSTFCPLFNWIFIFSFLSKKNVGALRNCAVLCCAEWHRWAMSGAVGCGGQFVEYNRVLGGVMGMYSNQITLFPYGVEPCNCSLGGDGGCCGSVGVPLRLTADCVHCWLGLTNDSLQQTFGIDRVQQIKSLHCFRCLSDKIRLMDGCPSRVTAALLGYSIWHWCLTAIVGLLFCYLRWLVHFVFVLHHCRFK